MFTLKLTLHTNLPVDNRTKTAIAPVKCIRMKTYNIACNNARYVYNTKIVMIDRHIDRVGLNVLLETLSVSYTHLTLPTIYSV